MEQTNEVPKNPKEIERLIGQIMESGLKFAKDTIKDSKLRADYIKKCKQACDSFKQQLQEYVRMGTNGREACEQLAREAHRCRNAFLEATRKDVSSISKNFSTLLKEQGLEFQDLLNTKALKKFNTEFNNLNSEDQFLVLEELIESSGRTNKVVNAFSKWSSRIAVVLIVITLAISIYVIMTSEEKFRTSLKVAAELSVGFAGGALGYKIGAALGACGGPIGVIIGSVVFGIAGGFIGSLCGGSLMDYLYVTISGKKEEKYCPFSMFDEVRERFIMHSAEILEEIIITSREITFDSSTMIVVGSTVNQSDYIFRM